MAARELQAHYPCMVATVVDRKSRIHVQQQSHTTAADMGATSRKIEDTISFCTYDGGMPPGPDREPGAPNIEATRLGQNTVSAHVYTKP